MSEREPYLRVPPNATEAEQYLIGCVLNDNAQLDAVGANVSAEHFYRHEHRTLWSAIARLVASGGVADVVSASAAAGMPLSEVNALAQCVVTTKHAPHYARMVARCARLRAVIAMADDLAAEAFAADADAERIIGDAISKLLALQVGAQQNEPRLLADVLPEVVDQINAQAEGRSDALPTGLKRLDDLTSGGMRPGELWVVGARPSMGKTAASLTLSRNVAGHHAVLVLTQEDSTSSVAMRQVAAVGRVNLSALRDPQRAPDSMWGKLLEAVDDLQPLRLYIDDQAGLRLADVRRKVQQVRRRDSGLRVVVVDYLQLMEGDGDNRSQELGALSNGLKRLAKEFGLTVVLLSQLNREADKRTGVPQMGDLRESGDIEGAADVVALLHREFRRTGKPHQKHWAQLHVAKQKNGPTETISLYFEGETQRFADWDGPPPREGDEHAQ